MVRRILAIGRFLHHYDLSKQIDKVDFNCTGGEFSSILAFVFSALSNHFVRPCQYIRHNRQAICLAAFKLMSSSNFVAAPRLFFWTIVINLRHHVDHLVAEAFLGCYLDRGVPLQLQRL
jgi:hypothetical protein